MRKTDYDYYRNALRGERLPLAFVDLDLLFINCEYLLNLAGKLPVRLATKSIRSAPLLRLVLDKFNGFRGLMAYSAQEAAYLFDQGFDDILIAYPTVEEKDIEQAVARIKSGAHIIFMIDCLNHATLLSQIAEKHAVSVSACIDLDMSASLPGLFFGVKRSPVRSAADVETLVQAISGMQWLKVCGLMGYEAQMAGVPDRHPGKALQNPVVRLLKALTFPSVKKRRAEAVTVLKKNGITNPLVNGGGSGSLDVSGKDLSLTELTAGSGLFAPQLFDFYRSLVLMPAAGFALPVTRRPDASTVTCHGGGYAASGAAGRDRLPTPFLPEGLRLTALEGAGEVQTPLKGNISQLNIGDPVFFRHAKAGELCEHFNKLILIRNGKIEDRINTYRGDGRSFL